MRRVDHSWIILSTGFVVLFFSGGSRFAFGLMLKPMAEDLEWSRSALSLAVTSFMIVSALALPVVGRLVDRYSLRWVLAVGIIAAAVGIGLMGRVTAPWQVFLLYGIVFAIGNATSSISPVGVMISRWFPRHRGTATSAAISGNAAGQLVLITVLASVLTSISWRTAFAILGIANFVIALPLVLAFVRSRPPSDGVQPAIEPGQSREQNTGTGRPVLQSGSVVPDIPAMPLSSILASRQLCLLVVVYGICGFQDFFVATHVVAFATDQGVGSLLAGNMLALMGLMGLIGVLLSGFLADKFGATRPTALCFLVRIAVLSLILFYQDTPGIIVFALLYGFTFLITAPLSVHFAGSIFGSARLGTVSGLISGVHSVGGGIGAFVGAVIFDWKGSYDGAFALMLGLSVLAVAATMLVKERPWVARPKAV